jgi:hypothetical protein
VSVRGLGVVESIDWRLPHRPTQMDLAAAALVGAAHQSEQLVREAHQPCPNSQQLAGVNPPPSPIAARKPGWRRRGPPALG